MSSSLYPTTPTTNTTIPILSHPPPPPPRKRGWVSKLGEKGIKRWARRYFVLSKEGLAYSLDDDTSTPPRGTIHLAHILEVQYISSSSIFEGILTSSGGYWQIASRQGRIYYLYCDTKEDAEEWASAVNSWREYYQAYLATEDAAPQDTSASAPTPRGDGPADHGQPDPAYDGSPHASSPRHGVVKSDSPYAAFLEFERSRLPPVYNVANGAPSALAQLVLQPPPQPPRPLRVVTSNFIKEIAFEEGDPLKVYRDLMIKCCDILLEQVPIPTSCYHIVCAYLVVCSLEWDNRNARTTVFPCAPSWDADPLSPYMTYLIALIRKDIISSSNLPMGDAPTLVTQIDTWIRRKRRDHEFLVQREDRESFVKRNVALVHYVTSTHLASSTQPACGASVQTPACGYHFAAIEDAALVLQDRLLEALDHLPHVQFAGVLWASVRGDAKPDPAHATDASAHAALQSVLWAYMLFQKLKQEDDRAAFADKDPHLVNAQLAVLNQFAESMSTNQLAGPFFQPRQRTVQAVMMMVFMKWQKELPLLYNVTKSDAYALYLLNLRIVARIVSKVQRAVFPRLQDALLELMAAIHQRLPPHPQYTAPATPFPSIQCPDAYELSTMVRRSFAPPS